MKVSDLVKFGKNSLRLYDEYMSEGRHTPTMRVYIRYYVTTLNLSENGSGYEGTSEIIQKPDFSTIIYNFIKENVRPTQEFIQISESIAKKYKRNIDTITFSSNNELRQSAYWLESFIRRLIYEKLEGTFSEESLIEDASLFKSELELSPQEHKYVDHVDGIFLENDLIKMVLLQI